MNRDLPDVSFAEKERSPSEHKDNGYILSKGKQDEINDNLGVKHDMKQDRVVKIRDFNGGSIKNMDYKINKEWNNINKIDKNKDDQYLKSPEKLKSVGKDSGAIDASIWKKAKKLENSLGFC